MTNNVYKFPGRSGVQLPHSPKADPTPAQAPSGQGPVKKLLSGVVTALWFVLALVWPVLRWVIALDIVFRGAAMVWHWDTPGTYAGWTFAAHFAVFVVLTFFVSVFKPKGVK